MPHVGPDGSPVLEPKPKRGMTRTQKILFFATGWLIVLMPFLFWWSTWFGRHLSDQQMDEYLRDAKKPRHIQHALVQLGDRMAHGDSASKHWYPNLVNLAANPVEEVRNTDAWVMGQDTSGLGFHETLLKMLADTSPVVRGNAALSLVRFGDASGRSEIAALLKPAEVRVPTSGPVGPGTQHDSWSDPARTASIVDATIAGTSVREGGVIAVIATPVSSDGTAQQELRSPITGRVRSISAVRGHQVKPGAVIAVIDPSMKQVWEALRALYVIGQLEDLDAVRPYERDVPEVSNEVRQQAIETEKAIRTRAGTN